MPDTAYPGWRTLRRPAGERVARVATVSDIHVGQHDLGRLPRFHNPPNLRCLEAALAEIEAWQPDLLVMKGDLTDHGRADEWRAVAAALGAVTVPVVATMGNHDSRDPDRVDGAPILREVGVDVTPPGGVVVRDLAGLRVILADTTTGGHNLGSIASCRPEVVEALASTANGALVAIHHHLMALPVPYFWPPGIPRAAGLAFARELHEANPRVLLTSGHTHRHRARRRGPIQATEVGAVRDYPGVWAMYEAYEGGITQVVRRIAAPDVLRWTDRTATTALRVWGRWSPGRVSDRCLTVDW